jgi:hypothetical protein
VAQEIHVPAAHRGDAVVVMGLGVLRLLEQFPDDLRIGLPSNRTPPVATAPNSACRAA